MRAGSIVFALGMVLMVAATACDAPRAPTPTATTVPAASAPRPQALPQLIVFHSPL